MGFSSEAPNAASARENLTQQLSNHFRIDPRGDISKALSRLSTSSDRGGDDLAISLYLLAILDDNYAEQRREIEQTLLRTRRKFVHIFGVEPEYFLPKTSVVDTAVSSDAQSNHDEQNCASDPEKNQWLDPKYRNLVSASVVLLCASLIVASIFHINAQRGPAVPESLFAEAQLRIAELSLDNEAKERELSEWRKRYEDLLQRSREFQDNSTSHQEAITRAIEQGDLQRAEKLIDELETELTEQSRLDQSDRVRAVEARIEIAKLEFKFLKAARLYERLIALSEDSEELSYAYFRDMLGALSASGRFETGLIALNEAYDLMLEVPERFPNEHSKFLASGGKFAYLRARLNNLADIHRISRSYDVRMDEMSAIMDELWPAIETEISDEYSLATSVNYSNALLKYGRIGQQALPLKQAARLMTIQLDFAVSINDQYSVAGIQHNLAETYGHLAKLTDDRSLSEKSLTLWRKSLDSFSTIGDENGYWTTAHYLAGSLERCFKDSDNLNCLREAVLLRKNIFEYENEIPSSQRKAPYYKAEYLSSLIQLKIHEEKYDDLLKYLFEMKALDGKIGKAAFPLLHENVEYWLYKSALDSSQVIGYGDGVLEIIHEHAFRLIQLLESSDRDPGLFAEALAHANSIMFRKDGPSANVIKASDLTCKLAANGKLVSRYYREYLVVKCSEFKLLLGEAMVDKGALEAAIYWAERSIQFQTSVQSLQYEYIHRASQSLLVSTPNPNHLIWWPASKN